MRVARVCIREHQEQSEGPEEKASRYTMGPGTLGSTLHHLPLLVLFQTHNVAAIRRHEVSD
jgi:hypothetical protein